MIIKRFGFSKITKGDISTPTLLKCGEDVRFEENYFYFLDKKIKRGVLYTPDIEQKEIKISENIYLIPNASTFLKNSKKFVDYTISIREKYGWDKLFYIPGMRGNLYPIVFYLGYDIFDDCLSKIECYEPWGKAECGEYTADEIFNITLRAVRDGRLREFVEGIPDNKSQEMLRYLDYKYFELQEKFYPVWKESFNAVTLQSLYRPDVRRWMERLKKRYSPPSYARYLLLLPCSAKKPYSISKTHRRIRENVKSTMHEVIITSPLGLVPRELEMFYPAQNYDIPTIGLWYEEEKKIIRDLLTWYLKKFEYEEIVSYLPENMKFLKDILDDFQAIQIWGEDLKKLREETEKINYRISRRKMLKENLKSLARFQFSCCDSLIDNAKIVGRYPRIDIVGMDRRVFGFDPRRGMLTLTHISAEELKKKGKYLVEIDDFYPEGDVFAVGIVNATSDIREGDEVAVVHEGEVRAWGTARMNYYDMLTQKEGKAVKIRGRMRKE